MNDILVYIFMSPITMIGVATIIMIIQNRIKNKIIFPILLLFGLLYCFYKIKTRPSGSWDAVGHGLYYGFFCFYFIICLLFLILSYVMQFMRILELVRIPDIDENDLNEFKSQISANKIYLINTNNDIYFFRKEASNKLLGCLIIISKDDGMKKVEIIDSDKNNKNIKIKLIIKKIKELGYKKIIVNKDAYNYLENSFDKYNIKSIENADGYMLEL